MQNLLKDYYYILGVKPNASIEDIKRAHRKLSHKFHPDKNDGDDFFAERFKDIQEAYETLTDLNRREIYDLSRNGTSSSDYTAKSILKPEIKKFFSNKDSFEIGQKITINWETVNANKVTIQPFGEVSPTGEKTYKISNCYVASLKIELIAENTEIGTYEVSTILVKNNSYKIYRPKTQQEIEIEKKQKKDDENYNNKLRKLATIALAILGLFILFRVIEQLIK